MKLRRTLFLAGIAGTGIGLSLGCSSVDQLNDPEPEFETLTVAYQHPGLSNDPCFNLLPKLDGVAEDQEWSSAEPLFVRMSGENGSGGADFFLEVRAIWSDVSRTGEAGDRIYFLIRYPDTELNARPDDLAFMRSLAPGEYCETPVEANNQIYCPSPPPVYDVNRPGSRCDPALLQPGSWTRINRDGQEDQVFLTFTEAEGPETVTSLIEANSVILGNLGPDVPSGVRVPSITGPLDIWAWRAGRTNLHPVYQFANWEDSFDDDGFPLTDYAPQFEFKCGFCEDLYVGGDGTVVRDAGRIPYVKNFGRVDPLTQVPLPGVPVRLTECPETGRDTDADLASLNGGVPKDLGLWWPNAKNFSVCDTSACSRTGIPPKWSTRLVPGEFDRVPGWGMQVPSAPRNQDSSADVRARATHEATQEKGFAIRTLEIMRDMNTQNSDDLVITPSGSSTKEYRLVIGVLDNSSRIGSGSTEIRLRFEAPKPSSGSVDRC